MLDFLPPSSKCISSNDLLLEYLTPKGVLYLILNRPEVRNAFNQELIEELTHALENAIDNSAVKTVVLTGAGSAFCAGGDIQYMHDIGNLSFQENKEDALKLAYLMNLLHEFPKPTIARVNGAAFGGGVGLLCCCDMAFGNPSTKICLSEITIGMVPATIGPYVIKAIGPRNAHRFMLSAEIVEGEKAVQSGFLSEIYETHAFDQKIIDLTEKICSHAPEAVKISKTLLLNLSFKDIDESVIDYTAEIIANVRESEEGKKGLQVFLDKKLKSKN
jgi:methylglutaconyl-CoA hydratase